MKRLILLALVLSSASLAQLREPYQRRPIERLESLKKVRMLEAIKLDEATGVKLVNRYTKNRETIWDLEKERREIMDKLAAQLQSNAADAEFQKTFEELLAIERKITDVRVNYLHELKEVLTIKQVAEYLVFERNFAKDIRDIMRDIRGEREKD